MLGDIMEKSYICCICESECEREQLKQFKRKGKIKKICDECVTAIKGMI